MNKIGKGRKAAKQFLSKYKLKERKINLNTVARFLNIKIIQETLPKNISGVFFREGKHLFIYINDNHPEQRQRFSIAHEIGHYLVHSTSAFNFGREEQFFLRAKGIFSPDEVDANQFAAELLMNEELLTKDFYEDASLESLAKKYDVSMEAMNYRLINLGLI